MWNRFTIRAKRIVFYAQEKAEAQGNTDVAPEHLLLGVLQEVLTKEMKADETVWPPAPTDRLDPRNAIASLLRQPGSDLEKLQLEAKRCAASLSARANANDICLTPSAIRIIDLMYQEAKLAGAAKISAEFLLLALIADKTSTAGKLLALHGFDLESARQRVAVIHMSAKKQKPAKPSLLTQFAQKFSAKPKDNP